MTPAVWLTTPPGLEDVALAWLTATCRTDPRDALVGPIEPTIVARTLQAAAAAAAYRGTATQRHHSDTPPRPEETMPCSIFLSPNAWQTVEAAWDNPASGNSMRNTTALSAPGGASVTTNFLVQWGLAVRKKSGAAGNPRAEITVSLARSDT